MRDFFNLEAKFRGIGATWGKFSGISWLATHLCTIIGDFLAARAALGHRTRFFNPLEFLPWNCSRKNALEILKCCNTAKENERKKIRWRFFSCEIFLKSSETWKTARNCSKFQIIRLNMQKSAGKSSKIQLIWQENPQFVRETCKFSEKSSNCMRNL